MIFKKAQQSVLIRQDRRRGEGAHSPHYRARGGHRVFCRNNNSNPCCCSSDSKSHYASAIKRNCGLLFLMVEISSTQYRCVSFLREVPHVRSKIELIHHIAMSQRTPSH